MPSEFVFAPESALLSNLAVTLVFLRGFPLESRNCTPNDCDFALYAIVMLFWSSLNMVVFTITALENV